MIIVCILALAFEIIAAEKTERKQYQISTMTQLAALTIIAMIMILIDLPKCQQVCILVSWVLQNVMLIVTLPFDKICEEEEEGIAAEKAYESIVARPMHQAVLIMYVFTQGLSFKQ